MKQNERFDRRQRRTKKWIRQALLELSEEKGLHHVTVKDLAERAEINRGTFYLHYQDVVDLLERLKGEIFEGLISITSEINPLEIRLYAERGEPHPSILKILEYFLSQSDFLRVMLGPNGDSQLSTQIRELMSERMFQQYKRYMPLKVDYLVSWNYFVAYMSSANLGVITHWLGSGADLTAREVALILTQSISQGPLETLLRDKAMNISN